MAKLFEFGGGFERSLPKAFKLTGFALIDELSVLGDEVREEVGADAEVDEIAGHVTMFAQGED